MEILSNIIFQKNKFQEERYTTMPKTIRQTVTLLATPHDVFEMLMDSKKHAKFSGAIAAISRKVGGKFSAYDGYCAGKNLELIPDEKIVQEWRASDWKETEVSKVTFQLSPTKNGTKLSFTQSGVPDKHVDAIKQGWKDFYWEPMKKLLEGK